MVVQKECKLRMKPLRVVVLCSFFALALLSCSLPAFPQTLEPRLKGAITESSRVTLPHSRTPLANGAEDLGAVSPDRTIPGITLVFSRSAAQEAVLQQLLATQQSAGSPLFHQWLTPDAFAARFGIADQDIAATETWLSSRGFHIDSVARSRDRITFSGTAAQVESAFGTQLHRYRTQAELHFAPASDLTLPAELAPITAAVLHLSDFRPKPNISPSINPDISAHSHPSPDYTALSTQAHYLGPKDIATMYDLNPLYQKNLYGGGEGLAVVGQSYLNNVFQPPVGTFLLNLIPSTASYSAVLVPNWRRGHLAGRRGRVRDRPRILLRHRARRKHLPGLRRRQPELQRLRLHRLRHCRRHRSGRQHQLRHLRGGSESERHHSAERAL